MFTKPIKSNTQRILEVLHKRTNLTVEQQRALTRQIAGYQGEQQFYQLLKERIRNEPIALYNLQLKINGSECQIDCLLIFQNEVVLFEVKNYEGNFLIEEEKWYTVAEQEIRNPVHQLHRTELLVSQLLNKNNFPLKVSSLLIFINPTFHLYNTPLETPAVFYPQLNRYMEQLQNTPSRLNGSHHRLEKLLTSSHITNSNFESIPTYKYSSLKKGVICANCNGWMSEHGKKNMQCSLCSTIEPFEKSLMRNVKEFHMLFPDKKITVPQICDWTNQVISKYRIRLTLKKYSTWIDAGKGSHYVLEK